MTRKKKYRQPEKLFRRCPTCSKVFHREELRDHHVTGRPYVDTCRFCRQAAIIESGGRAGIVSTEDAARQRDELAQECKRAENSALKKITEMTGTDSPNAPAIKATGDVQVVEIETAYNPHPLQRAIHNSPARIRVAATGVRFGKTKALCFEILEKALQTPDGLFWIVAPTYAMLEVDMREWGELIAELPKGMVTHQVKERRFTFNTCRSMVEFRSGEWPNQLRGPGLAGIGIDEAAYLKEEAARICRTRVSDTRGWILAVSSPKGKNWFHRWFLRGLATNEYMDHESFRATSRDNPHFPPEEWEDAKRDVPEDFFRQEYEAQFLDEQAGVFRRIDSVVAKGPLTEGHPPFTLGVDLAKSKDYTVIIVMDGRGHVVHFQRMNELSWVTQKEEIIRVANLWKAAVYPDETGVGGPMVDELKVALGSEKIHGVKFTVESKRQMIQALQSAIEQRNIMLPSERILLDELRWYEYKRSPSGNLRYQAPQGFTDDCVHALALANWGKLQHAGAGPPVILDLHPERKPDMLATALSRAGIGTSGGIFRGERRGSMFRN